MVGGWLMASWGKAFKDTTGGPPWLPPCEPHPVTCWHVVYTLIMTPCHFILLFMLFPRTVYPTVFHLGHLVILWDSTQVSPFQELLNWTSFPLQWLLISLCISLLHQFIHYKINGLYTSWSPLLLCELLQRVGLVLFIFILPELSDVPSIWWWLN